MYEQIIKWLCNNWITAVILLIASGLIALPKVRDGAVLLYSWLRTLIIKIKSQKSDPESTVISPPITGFGGGSSGGGTDKFYGTVTRKGGKTEDYIWINTGKFGSHNFDFAYDRDGKDKREINIENVSRIDIFGSTKLIENGKYIKNIWAKCKITLHKGKPLNNVFINISGLGGLHEWYYKTKNGYGSRVDENVVRITFNKKNEKN